MSIIFLVLMLHIFRPYGGSAVVEDRWPCRDSRARPTTYCDYSCCDATPGLGRTNVAWRHGLYHADCTRKWLKSTCCSANQARDRTGSHRRGADNCLRGTEYDPAGGFGRFG